MEESYHAVHIKSVYSWGYPMLSFSCFQSPFGTIRIGIEDGYVVSLRCVDTVEPSIPSPLSEFVEQQLHEYFSGKRKHFDFPLRPAGTPFQKSVWQTLLDIPYGQTRTYGQIATAIGKPRAVRAVGMACNRNPIWIVIPCHRVIGANSALTGYAGGLPLKRALLELEQS